MKWQNQVVFPLLIINASGTFTGLFVYSPSIGLNNLIASVTAQSGTDPYGNAYLAGVAVYGPGGESADLLGAALNLINNSLTNSIFTSILVGDTNNRWAVNTAGRMVWGPGNAITDTDLFRAAAATLQTDGSLAFTNEAFPAGIAGAAQILANSGELAQVYASGQAARLSTGRLADVSVVTVTAVGANDVFHDTIKGGEAVAGATYRARAFGFGAWAAVTGVALQFSTRFGALASTTIGTQPSISGTALAAGALFRWDAEATLTCVTAGVSATWVCNLRGCVTQTANQILPGTAADNTIPFSGGTGSGTVTLDSTVDEIFGISAGWASTTNAPTMTKVSGIMERIA